jgi:diacylglycerol kinase (ATP)
MSKLPIPLFVNPTAARGRTGRNISSLSNLLYANEIDHDIIESRSRGDIESQVRRQINDGAESVIVAGGDGTIHEAVNGMLQADLAAALGVIPMGTGNDFAKACTMPPHWEDAAVLLADRIRSHAPNHQVDVGQMNDRYFANSAGIGFDAKVTRIAESIRVPIGDLVYLLAVFRAMIDGVETPELRIDYGNDSYSGSLTLASISNGDWVGGMFQIAPMARNDDGDLDLVFAKPVSNWRLLRLIPRLIQGTHIGQPEVVHAPIRHCEIVSTAPLPSHLDGEVQPMHSEFSIKIIENGLRLL